MFARDALRLTMPALVAVTLMVAAAPVQAEPGWAVNPTTGMSFNLPPQLPADQFSTYGPYPAYMNSVVAPQGRTFASLRVTGLALGPADAHIASCRANFRTYNVATDSYVGNDGRLHRCLSPY